MYECHITLDPKDREVAEDLAAKFEWKTSVLKGDVIMGDDPYLYLTCHHKSLDSMQDRLWRMVTQLNINGVEPLRQKIEHIIFDTKYSIGV